MHLGGTQRIRRLQGMTALHPPTAIAAVADVDIELAHQRSDERQILLILRRHADGVDRTATAGARVGQRGGVGLVDVAGARALRSPAIRRARTATWPPTMALPMRLRKRRGLSEAGPTRRVELLLQLLVPTLQPIALARDVASLTFGPRKLLTQPGDLVLLLIDPLIALIAWSLGHASVMTDSRKLYKYDFLDRQCRLEITPGTDPLNEDSAPSVQP